MPDEGLRDALRAVLIDLAGLANICMFLNSALRTKDPVAPVVFEHKPELLIQKLHGEDPLDLAASSGQANAIALFIRLAREEGRRHLTKSGPSGGGESPWCVESTRQQTTVLKRAAEWGHLSVIKKLVDFDKGLLDHGFPLHKAVKEGHVEVVKWLLDERFDLTEKFTPGPYPRSALYEERTFGKDNESPREIEKLLMAKIIKGGGRGKSPRVIRKLSKGPPGIIRYFRGTE